MVVIGGVLAGLMPVIPALLLQGFYRRRRVSAQTARNVVVGFVMLNAVWLMAVASIGLAWFASPSVVALALGPGDPTGDGDPYRSLAEAISVGLSAIGAGISVGGAAIGAGVAVSGTGAAAIGAIAEKPESLGQSLIFVGLAEGIAIYGLLISFMILNR